MLFDLFPPARIMIFPRGTDVGLSLSDEASRANRSTIEVLSRDRELQYARIELILEHGGALILHRQTPERWSREPARGAGWHITAGGEIRHLFPRNRGPAPVNGQRDRDDSIGVASTLLEAIELAEYLTAQAAEQA